MAGVFPAQVSASQVGSYFVTQYYHILQQQPNLVYQFYTDASTMVRIDGAASETANGMMQIDSLIMTLNFTGIEIKTAHFLDSWEGGVLVVISGFMQTKEYDGTRKFEQTIFLAPQEKGYFVLNDVLHLLDEEQIHQYPAAISHNNYESNIVSPRQLAEPVSEYMLGGEIQSRDYVDPAHVEEGDTVDKYSIPEQQQQVYSIPEQQQQVYSIPEQQQQAYSIPEQQQQVYSIPESQQVSEIDNRVDESHVEDTIASFQSVVSVARDPPPAPAEEPAGEQPKQTYASILRLAKAQAANVVPQAAPSSKPAPAASDRGQAPQSAPQQTYHAGPANSEAAEEGYSLEDEGEEKSVYVGNVPSALSESDLEQEFKDFGRIKPDGVAIRSRKDSGGYYAFVEFEDVIGVRNALKASPIIIKGWQIYVEERRPNSSMSRGGRRGRGRGGYQSEAPRGRYGGRGYGRSSGQESDRDYNSRSRANGVQRVPRQERGILGNHVSRNGQYPSDN